MTPNQYVQEAMRSFKEGFPLPYNITHALMGLSSETGEIAHTIKKHIIYEQPLDLKNLDEEIGDLMWYVAALCYSTNLSLEACLHHNIEKLKKRYPEKFTPAAAMARADKDPEHDDVAQRNRNTA